MNDALIDFLLDAFPGLLPYDDYAMYAIANDPHFSHLTSLEERMRTFEYFDELADIYDTYVEKYIDDHLAGDSP